MSVYTSVSDDEMCALLAQYDLGDFVSLVGIAQGVTNSNYFVTTSTGRFVLTIFKALKVRAMIRKRVSCCTRGR